MKRFSEIQKKTRLRAINEAEEAGSNLPQNFQNMSKEELIKLMSGKSEIENNNDGEEKPQTKDKAEVAKFISKLLESREMAQVYHWTVNGEMGSHAAHLALQAYYEGVIEFIDGVVEIFQGQYGLLEGYDIIDTTGAKKKNSLEYFQETAEITKASRKCIKAEDTHIHNLLDEIVGLQYRTIYKLTYNK